MKNVQSWSRVLVIAGIVGMILGAIDPLEGWPVIVLGVAVAAGGALVGQTRRRKLLYAAFALTVAGAAAMVILSQFGGIGGRSGHSLWWAIVLIPYPVGWLLGLAGAIAALVERAAHRDAPTRAAT